MDKVNENQTVYFKNTYLVGIFERIEMVNYLWQRKHLVQSQKIMKYRNILKSAISV